VSCFFQKGNRITGAPASIILYGFSNSFTRLRFAFTANNPAPLTSTVIPLNIYTLSGNSEHVKTYYQFVQNAIVVLSVPIPASATGYTPVFSPTAVRGVSAVNIQLSLPEGLTLYDYIAIKTPPMLSYGLASITKVTMSPLSAQINVIVLPKNRFIILQPLSAESSNPSVVIGIPGYQTPEIYGSPDRAFYASITHFSTMKYRKLSYQNCADFTIKTSFETDPIVSLSTYNVTQNSIFNLNIELIFYKIRSLIIAFPPELDLREDCYETLESDIPVESCFTNPSNRRVYITLENQTYPTVPKNLKVSILTTNGGSLGPIGKFNYWIFNTI